MHGLESGEWRPGDSIPSESELAVRFGVSQGTVRKAVDEMAAENLLVRQQGKGTFVATHKDPGSFFRFLRLVPPRQSVHLGLATRFQSVFDDCIVSVGQFRPIGQQVNAVAQSGATKTLEPAPDPHARGC